jgi:hypothetical protein
VYRRQRTRATKEISRTIASVLNRAPSTVLEGVNKVVLHQAISQLLQPARANNITSVHVSLSPSSLLVG